MALPRGWEKSILRGIGAPVTSNNITLLQAWQRAEGGGTANDANWNPLNTTQPMPGAGSINSVGVRSYRSAQQGIEATIKTLTNGHYWPIIQALRKSARPVDTAKAIAQTPWGTAEGVLRVLGSGFKASPAASPQSYETPGRTLPAPSTKMAGPPVFKFSVPQANLTAMSTDLGKVAQGWDPVDLLQRQSENMLGGLLRPSRLSVTRPQITSPGAPMPSTSGRPAKIPTPGGSWGGTYQPATRIAKLGEQYGLVPTSQKRDRQMTASGNVSDHWVGSKNAYAYDLGGSVAEMDKAAKAITARLGIPYKQGQSLVANKTANGLRYQILYRTNVGGNHYNHIHVGVKRL